MSKPFGPILKIATARERMTTFYSLARQYFTAARIAIVVEIDQNGDKIAYLRCIDPVPEELYILVGECVYHLRSALDLLIVAIATANGGTGKGNYFPFAGDEEEFKSKGTRRKLRDVPEDIVALIDAMKPYKGGDDLLWAMGRLANIDRHNELVPFGGAGAVHKFPSAGKVHLEGGKWLIDAPRQPVSLEKGIPLANLGTNGRLTVSPDIRSELRLGIAFGESVDKFAGQAVVGVMQDLTDLTESIVKTIRAHCFR